MPGQNGTSPTEIHADPTGVFGRAGRQLPLGEVTVTIRMLTNRQVKAQFVLLDAMTYLLRAGTEPGRQFYEGAISHERQGEPDPWVPMAAWLSAWCQEPVTSEQLEDATPDEVIDLINAIFEQSGLAWLRRQLGNAATVAAAAAMLQQPPPANAPIGTESDSMTSTTSSSTSPAPPPTPEQTSPSTD